MWTNSHKTTGLITCTKEILNRHLKFLCSASSSQSLHNKIKYWVQRFPTPLIFAISQKTLCGPARKVSFINFLETLPYDIKAFLTNSFILKGPTTIWSTQSYSNLQIFQEKKQANLFTRLFFMYFPTNNFFNISKYVPFCQRRILLTIFGIRFTVSLWTKIYSKWNLNKLKH